MGSEVSIMLEQMKGTITADDFIISDTCDNKNPCNHTVKCTKPDMGFDDDAEMDAIEITGILLMLDFPVPSHFNKYVEDAKERLKST